MKIIAAILLIFTAGCALPSCKDIPEKHIEIKEENKSYQLFLLKLHNKERENRGLKSFEVDKNLCEYAEDHAKEMAESEKIFHSDISNLNKFGCTEYGENVAYGQKTEESVVNDWMWSLGHRWNILGQNYKKAGFGLAIGEDGDNYWCVVFSN